MKAIGMRINSMDMVLRLGLMVHSIRVIMREVIKMVRVIFNGQIKATTLEFSKQTTFKDMVSLSFLSN